MAQCQFCGRELRPGELCGCTIQSPEMQGYFRIAIKKETVEKITAVPKAALTAAGRFFTSLREVAESGSEDGVLNTTDGHYENDMQIVDQCVVPTEQEITIRQYDVARMSTPFLKKAYGRLQVTNKRVIFRSAGRSLIGPIITEKEFAIEEIGGIDIKVDYRFSILDFICSILICFALLALFTLLPYWLLKSAENLEVLSIIWSFLVYFATFLLMLGTTHKRALKSAALSTCCASSVLSATVFSGSDGLMWFCFICAGITSLMSFIMLILSGIVDDLQICIKVKGGHDALEIARKLPKDERSGFVTVKPWKDTQFAIRELGALINDIKLLGDAGIEKWKV